MARFFLHVDSGGERITDPEGSVCDDLKTACKQAMSAVTEMAAEQLKAGTERIQERITVADERGEELLTVKVEAAIHVER